MAKEKQRMREMLVCGNENMNIIEGKPIKIPKIYIQLFP